MKQIIGGIVVLVLAGGLIGGAPRAGDDQRTVDAAVAARAAFVGPDQVIARVGDKSITMAELQKPMLEGYGLKVLMQVMRLNLAKQLAVHRQIEVTQADFDAELERTEKTGFQDAAKEDYSALLEQLLEKKGISRGEFDMVVQTNAILRKVAEPELRGKIADVNVEEAFNVLYGETVSIKHIQLSNPQEAYKAKTRLASGEKFETVVQTMSHLARTRDLDGELPPFSRQTVDWGSGWGKVPQGFKDWAFTAKVGETSDPVAAEGGYHILKLEQRLAPKAVKLDAALRASLKANLEEKLMEQGVNELRGKLDRLAVSSMVIDEPILKKQFEAKRSEQSKSVNATDQARKDILGRMKPAADPRNAADPNIKGSVNDPKGTSGTPAAPIPGAAVSPTDASTGERPPAIKSAVPTPADKAGK